MQTTLGPVSDVPLPIFGRVETPFQIGKAIRFPKASIQFFLKLFACKYFLCNSLLVLPNIRLDQKVNVVHE